MRWIGACFSVTLAILVLQLSGCSTEDAEARIRATIAEMEQLAEAGNVSDFMDYVADDFSGDRGGVDRNALSNLLRIQIMKHTRVSANVLSQDYELFEGRAVVKMTVLLTGGPRSWLPDSGRVYQFDTSWRESGGDWLLLAADWQAVVGTP
jgi:hypothetical protein